MSHFIILLSGLLGRVSRLCVRTGIRRAIWARAAYILVILSLLTQSSAQAIGLSVAPAAQASAPALKSVGNTREAAAGDQSIGDSALLAIEEIRNFMMQEGTPPVLRPDLMPTTSATTGSDSTANGDASYMTAQATPETTVTVATTSDEINPDSDTSSVSKLKEHPGSDGLISFPEALAAVNNTGPGFTINFDPGLKGQTIFHDSSRSFFHLRVSNTTIDGDVDDNGIPEVQVGLIGSSKFYLLVITSSNNVIRNFAIEMLRLEGDSAHDNQIIDSNIGTDVAGLVARPEEGNGLEIVLGAHHNIVKNNVIAGNLITTITGSGSGVLIAAGAHDNVVRGNKIGINRAGQSLPNEVGVFVLYGAWQNTIGGERSSPACNDPCNIISNNSEAGVSLQGTQGIVYPTKTSSNVVQGNFIGVGPTGADPMPNGWSHAFGRGTGVSLEFGATQNTIGGARATEACNSFCNVISGNSGPGVDFTQSETIENYVQGNFIGVDVTGQIKVPNVNGIWVDDGASHNTIGGERAPGSCVGPCNLIRGNTGAGIKIPGQSTQGNTIRGNDILYNGGLGIDLSGDGVTANDPHDVDIGPNDLMNFPVDLRAVFDPNSNKTTIRGTLDTVNPASLKVDIYNINVVSPPSFSQGWTYLGAATPTPIPTIPGRFMFTLTVNGQLLLPILSATATDGNGSTSELMCDPNTAYPPANSNRDGPKDKDELNTHPAGNTVITLTYEILMESRRFVPEAGLESSILDLAAMGAGGPTHILLQFYDTPTEGQKAQLKAQGIELLHYIPNNAWIASVQPSALETLSSNPSLRWGGMLTAQDRTSSLIADETLRAFYANKDKTLPLMVEFASDVSLDQAKEIVARFGGGVKSEVVSINSLLIHLPPNRFDALAREDEIIWVEPALPALVALNDCVRYRIGGDALEATPYSLNGSGVDLLVYDAGTVATTHSGFTGRLSVKDSSGTSDHATHVAGTAAGSGAGTPGNKLRGMAPAARILSYGFEGFGDEWLYNNPGDIEHDWNEAKNSFGADQGTASIGTNTASNGFPCDWEGNYGQVGQLLDAIVRGSLGEPYIATWAAGNERGNGRCGTGFGTTAPPSGAKNPIHVGATNSDTDAITSFSSFGPTDDGRIKPTISAPGCEQGGDAGINSAIPPNGYGVMCGTSMATPAVAGLVSLMIQQYRATFSSTGEPWPSTIKAILIHTAVDRGNAGPDYQYGYGRVDGLAAVDTIIGGDFRQESISVTGEYHDYSYSHAGGPLKVSLAWDDAPATPSAAIQLVNDLDLTLISPSRQTFRPFILNPANPGQVATKGPDHLNNQEQIIVPNAAAGTWKIRVRAQNLPVAPQGYSIVFKDAGTTTPTIVRPFTATLQDGWILESTETSNVGGTMDGAAATFNVGDNAADKQFRGILSFNTAALPDSAVITAVTFRVLQQSIAGTNPFTTHGNLLMDIKLGAFGGSAALQLVDFQAAANQSGIPIPNAPVAGWYSKNLPPGALTLINKTGFTQFRLRFARDDNDDLAADLIRFFSGNAPAANRPQLIIQYHLP